MINIDTHFFPEARHVDFMTAIKERSWFANTTNHDAFQTVSNLLWEWTVFDRVIESWVWDACGQSYIIFHTTSYKFTSYETRWQLSVRRD